MSSTYFRDEAKALCERLGLDPDEVCAIHVYPNHVEAELYVRNAAGNFHIDWSGEVVKKMVTIDVVAA